MASFNQITILGNLTRDPELRFLPNQTAVCSFSIATNRKYKTGVGEQKEEVMFIECTAWAKGGELINQYCKKGSQLFLTGHVRQDSWEDKNGGGKRSKHVVVVDNFQFLGGGRVGGEDDQRTPYDD